MKTAWLALALAALAHPALADDARPQPRMIAPDLFAPAYRDAPSTSSAPNEGQRPAPAAVKAAPAPAPPAVAVPAAKAVPTPTTTVVANASPWILPSDAHPLGACERESRQWMLCLDATAKLTDDAIGDVEARIIQGLDHRANLNPVTRAAVTKALRSADWDFRALREFDCGDLPMIERGLEGPITETRLVCRIERNRERAQALTRRYGEAP